MPRASTVRGSDKLLNSKAMDPKELAALTRLTQAKGVAIVDWTILGQPGPDWVHGAVHVGNNQVGKFVGELVKLKKLRLRIEATPFGIPNPTGFTVRFRR